MEMKNDLNKRIKFLKRLVFIFLIAIYGSVLSAQVNSEWYIENQKQIDSLRKGDFVVQIVDDLGEPLDATVAYKLVKHEYPWGTALAFQGGADDIWYKATAQKFFNSGVNENDFKWSLMQPNPGPVNYDNVNNYIDWCDEAGWEMRGHTLLWGSKNYEDFHPLQKWVKDLPVNDMMDTCKVRVQREMQYYKGIIKEYDVMNEAIPGHADWLQQTVGDSINWNSFKWAREADPDAKLFINDYGVISGNAYPQYLKLIRTMLDNDAPVDGIGVQGHFSGSLNPHSVKYILDTLATLGLPIKVTEFDMQVGDNNMNEETQAKYYSLMMRTAFAHEAVSGFLFWGFWDSRHWRNEAGLFTSSKKPKIAADSVYNLLYNVWATNGQSSTNTGAIDLNAFYGTYEIIVNQSGEEKHFTVPMLQANEGDTITLQLSSGQVPPPLLDSAIVEKSTQIKLFFNKKMSTQGSEINDFIVFAGNQNFITSISQPTDDSTQIILELDREVTYLNNVSVSYFPGSLEAADGGQLGFVGTETVDNKLPGFRSGSTNENGSEITLAFSRDMAEPTIENLNDFTITVDDIEQSLVDIQLNHDDSKSLNLTVGEFIAPNTTVKVAYTPGTIKSADGGFLSEFTPKLVANNITSGINNTNHNYNIYGFYSKRNHTIAISNLENTGFTYSLINLSGQVILRNAVSTNSEAVINTSGLSSGLYILRFTKQDGQETKVQKLMIH